MADPTHSLNSLPAPPTAPRTAPNARRGRLASVAASVGAVTAAALASLCCVGPLVFVAFGVGAGLASAFEPLRPLFTALTVALLAVGFYVAYGRRPGARGAGAAGATDAVCAPDGSCMAPRNRTRDKVLLWAATVLALVILSFPQWSVLLV